MEREVRRDIEMGIAGEIENKARLALSKAQREYGVDIFDFAGTFRRKYPREWKELKDRWDEVFAGAEVEFAVEAHIRRSGLQGRRTSLRE